MNTEITELNKEWLFYDAECAICRGFAGRWEGRLERRGVCIAPLQGELAKKRLGIGIGEVPDEMKLLTASGGTLGGADAVIYLARYFWWGWGLRLLAHAPGVRFVLRRAYAWFARRRHCGKGGCEL